MADSSVFNGRVVAIGDPDVGKTSILNRLMEDQFNPNEPSTVGANWQLFVREFNGDRIELQIWDTAGQEKFRSLGPLYYRSAVGAVLVYSITERSSFESLSSWIASFTAVAGVDGTVMIIGNKCDLDEERVISQKEGMDWAKEHGYQFYEVSAKTGENVKAVFDALGERVMMAKSRVCEVPKMQPAEGKKCC